MSATWCVSVTNCTQKVGTATYPVKAPTDSLLDSRFLLSMSDMGAEMTRTRRVGADAFDMDDYLHRVAQYMGGHVVSGSDQRRAAQDVAAEAVATGDRELWDWEKLGRVAAQHTRRAPIPDFLLGPLHVVPKHRKVTRTSRLETDAEHIAPQQLEADDLAQSENETSRMVLEIATLLEAASGDEGVPLFAFALNPASFSNSVENLFYISFLIRDGKAAIVDDAEGDPLLMSTYEPTAEDRDAGLTRRQIVLELDMHTWKELCMLYNVTVPMIPTRTETQQAVGNTRWYG